MGLVKIITIIISSSVLAAILTSIFNFIIQNLNYKREYYKKIIDKRIEALEQIIDLSNQLKVMTHLENGQICNIIFTKGEDYYNRFIILLALTVNQSFWLNDELNETLLELNIFLHEEIENKIELGNEIDRSSQLILLGIDSLNKIREFRTKIEKQLLEDFSSMQRIRTFINSKRKADKKEFFIRKRVTKSHSEN